jgi:hypothetical protein
MLGRAPAAVRPPRPNGVLAMLGRLAKAFSFLLLDWFLFLFSAVIYPSSKAANR